MQLTIENEIENTTPLALMNKHIEITFTKLDGSNPTLRRRKRLYLDAFTLHVYAVNFLMIQSLMHDFPTLHKR